MAKFKQWRNEDRTPLKDVVPLGTPYNMRLEISSLCNLRCVYCAHSAEHGQFEGNMPMELFQKVIKDMMDFPEQVKKIDMFGFGESLMNPCFPDMVRIARMANVAERIDITTNGILLTPEKIDAVLAAGIDIIRISLQGLDAYSYKKTCGVSIDFEKFLRSLHYLYAHRDKTRVYMKIADVAIKGIRDGKGRLESLFGAISDRLYIETILPIYSNVAYDAIDTHISKNYVAGREGVPTLKVHKVCHRPFFRLSVRANGDITAACCDATRDVVYGNAYRDKVAQIWNGAKHHAFLKMQLQGKRFFHPSCKDCVMPNDITTQEDILDPWAEEILKRIG